MKLFVTLGLLCAIACAVQAQFPGGRRGGNGRGRLGGGGGLKFPSRFRREAVESGLYDEEVIESQGRRVRREPQGSIVVQGQQPLSGPHRQPSLDINYQHQLIDNDRTKLNTFGGAHLQNGRVTPQAGFGVEHTFRNNMFVHGGGQVQPGHRGRLEPSFGAGLGWRFRRDVPYEEESVNEEIEAVEEE